MQFHSARRLAHRALGRLQRSARKSTSEVEVIPPDDFLAWLSFINPGMLFPGNVYLLDYCLQNLKVAGAIVEIGSFAGLSLNHILHFARKYQRPNPVFSVDAWSFEGTSASSNIAGSDVSSWPIGSMSSRRLNATSDCSAPGTCHTISRWSPMRFLTHGHATRT